jgi:hypothetical protein
MLDSANPLPDPKPCVGYSVVVNRKQEWLVPRGGLWVTVTKDDATASPETEC